MGHILPIGLDRIGSAGFPIWDPEASQLMTQTDLVLKINNLIITGLWHLIRAEPSWVGFGLVMQISRQVFQMTTKLK